MSALNSNFYAQWRTHRQDIPRLGEPRNNAPPERLLQAVWHHQRLHREKLRTLDGRPVCVLHPGFWNREAGPDFRRAILRIGDGAPITGDVEIDLQPADWRGHGHHTNAAFERVILHVISSAPASTLPVGLPTLALEDHLDSPWAELAAWLGGESAGEWPDRLRGRCCAPLRELSGEQLHTLLKEAAEVRLQRKAHEFHARAREAGWEQALWEGLFRALGYKNNAWPFQRLAELRPVLADLRRGSPLEWQAWLFGVAGLLPPTLGPGNTAPNDYLQSLWAVWWRDRDALENSTLPRSLWRFHGLRPANHPERRLALAAHWLSEGKLGDQLEQWFAREHRPARRPAALLGVLGAPQDEFWSRHWTLRSAVMPKPQPLLGSTRVTDLATNVVLPWLLARAETGQNPATIKRVENWYFQWPAAEDNAVLRLARRRLLASNQPNLPRTAAAQQGLMQIVRDFCDQSNSVCDECGFPDLVRGLPV